ncbi:MAG: hypothetical protein HY922_15310 [Elusimicrobia bacterium]|nr:hypothetical protein [Elusimicrobiota bacterium]
MKAAILALACAAAASSSAAELQPKDPWAALWLPDASAVKFSTRAEFDGTEYETLSTKRFILHYPVRLSGEADRRAPLHAAARLDGLYEFLAERMGVRPQTSVTAVLIEGQAGHSKVIPEKNAVVTGERADPASMLGSFFHELVHLFNFAIPGASQDFWSGELFAQYHADRLLSLGLEHRARYRRLLASDPKKLDWSWIRMLDEHFAELPERERQQLMELGISVYYYLEDGFGAEKTLCFWRAHLDPAQRDDPKLWERCFGMPYGKLHSGWRRYYGAD